MQNALVPAPSSELAANPFSHASYAIKQPWLSFLGRKSYVHAPDGTLVAFVKHPVFKLRPEFTIFADESEQRPLLIVRTRKLMTINRAFDVIDAATQQQVGTIQSRGLKSIVRDTWDLLGPGDQTVGLVQEDGASWLRRFFPLLLGAWHIELQGTHIAKINQRFKFFGKEYTLDMSANQNRLDPRFAIAIAMLALMAESAREANSG